ncbi:hypothetical protein V6N13_001272 [Hibiscus sabdariffa]
MPGQDGGRLTYTGIVGASSRRNNGDPDGLEELTCDPNSVVESCVSKDGKNDSSKEGPMAPESAKVTSEDATKERDLFGPWMMVENRRKRVPNRGASSSREPGH